MCINSHTNIYVNFRLIIRHQNIYKKSLLLQCLSLPMLINEFLGLCQNTAMSCCVCPNAASELSSPCLHIHESDWVSYTIVFFSMRIFLTFLCVVAIFDLCSLTTCSSESELCYRISAFQPSRMCINSQYSLLFKCVNWCSSYFRMRSHLFPCIPTWVRE